MERSRETRPRRRRDSSTGWLLAGLVVAFLIAAGTTAYLTFAAVREVVASWDSPELPGVAAPVEEGEVIPEELGEAGEIPLQPDNGPEPKPWDGTSRVTMLVMGLDYRDWEDEYDAPRTDTMILLSVDPATRTAGMLSIPRDLWVNIPGFEAQKINQAYRLGELYDVPGGGPGLAMQTVEQTVGLEIDYYAQIDFNAFEEFIDELGGVKIDVPEEIDVDPMGDNNNKTLQPGVQVLPGDLALAYARARNTIGSDFDRAERQQQVILGIRDRVLSSEMLPTLIRRSPQIYETLSSGIRTNLTLMQTIRLAWLAQQIPEENIQRGVIGPEQVNFMFSYDGQDILQPVPEAIRLMVDEIFTTGGPPAPAAEETLADPQALMEAESASVAVLNGTLTPGLAAQTADYLRSEGLNNVSPGNAEQLYSQTSIIDYTGNPQTLQYLVDLINIPPNQIFHRYDEASQADIVLLLGEDWASNHAMP
jgi:polyisoprenyl-teichoic acid--peptidoglycan teichoic acid transferase